MKGAAALFAAFLLLTGCGDPAPKLTSGTVVEKHYDDDDSYYQPGVFIPGTTSCSGNPPICSTSPGVNVPGYWVSHPARWVLTIEGEADGKTIREEHAVPRDQYDRKGVGEPWSAS